MTLLNVDAALPSQTWALVRLLVYLGKSIALDEARALVSPPALRSDDIKSRAPFDSAVSSLVDLGLVHVDEEHQELSLAGQATALTNCDDLDTYTCILRRAILAADRNRGLGDDNDPAGPRDLTRALAWFLMHDPMEPPVDWIAAQRLEQDGKDHRLLKPEVQPIFVNATRWTRFGYWAPALGLAAAPLIRAEGSGPLVPDCTTAVKQTATGLWQAGQRMNAVEVLQVLREHLPVLPGGAHSLALGIPSPGENAAGAALSFALLRGHDEKWLRLEHDDDARHILLVHDPDRPASPRPVSDITILEATRG
ncbi:protein DpdG [Streptomyces sp. NBC_00557]|uniref:protein DpdG n=1 Tax=Streptomyces sp. NBC_00557 TaxID=2975776 RepID=UPI002E8190C2|nr:protein DpdG [Streptomyces sp. NBC_00557]WUC37140.1 protein DpdG [Streptomyces sp. NBC_00557]